MWTVYMYTVRAESVKLQKEMTYDQPMVTTARSPLSRERVIESAVAYADAHGVDDLSMRKLAAELGVGPMSLYNHVENKDDLYDGMIDYVFEGIQLPEADHDWKNQIRVIGSGAMRSFGHHPWIVYLLMARGNFGPGALRFMDHVLGLLNEAGFGDEDAHHAWQMLASHTIGYAFQASTGVQEEEDQLELQDELPRLAREYPNVARMFPLLMECSWDTEYMFGLEIILDGLESRLR